MGNTRARITIEVDIDANGESVETLCDRLSGIANGRIASVETQPLCESDDRAPAPGSRRFWLTRVVTDVLSEETPIEFDGLDDLASTIDTGDCVGLVSAEPSREITPLGAAQWLRHAGSEPSFMELDDQGRTLEF